MEINGEYTICTWHVLQRLRCEGGGRGEHPMSHGKLGTRTKKRSDSKLVYYAAGNIIKYGGQLRILINTMLYDN